MRSIFLSICIFVISIPAMAIVDVHDEYYAKPDLQAFSVFDFSFSGATGNKEEVDFELDTHTVVRRGTATWMLVAAASFAKTNDLESSNRHFLHGRYSKQLSANEKHGYEMLAQYGRDKFERLQRRLVIGAGYRYQWKPGTTNERGLLGVGIIREHELNLGQSQEMKLWRGNLYATVAIPLSLPQGASFSISTYLQPALNDLSNIRSVAVLGLKAQLSNRLAVKATIDQEYYSTRSSGIEKNNVTYTTGISFTLY
ncbi:MAG: hypothetical protein ACJAVI_003503 [Candidatus Azotimanducaceae bacterium]|jgi:hypothetical protein